MAAILAMMGRLWITKDTSFFCIPARFLAWPRRPNPVMSVAPWALNLCIRREAVYKNMQQELIILFKKLNLDKDKSCLILFKKINLV